MLFSSLGWRRWAERRLAQILGFGKEVGWTERTVGGREWQENGASCLHFEKRAAS
jgi:hypothetical protein